MILAIIIAWLAYKKAKENGRNPILWAFVGVMIFIGTQFAVSVGLGALIGFGVELQGWSEARVDNFGIAITIGAILASFFTSWLFLRWLGKAPRAENFTPPPPPPTDFSGDN